jgi:hypothetical protein
LRSPYVGDGKIPNSEMMKSTHRYGWKFVCGWLPPVAATEFGLIGELGDMDI